MTRRLLVGAVVCGVCGLVAALSRGRVVHAGAAVPAPVVAVPKDYREWVYLSSGLDMTYTATAAVAQPPTHDGQFDNVFVNPEAYRAFKQSGAWPDGTVFVLENRAAKGNVSINKGGRTQGAEVSGIELHVKQGDGWSFYGREADGREHLIARPASCYTCHEAHAAVDTTFVQFYPTIAREKGVVSAGYVAEERAQAGK